MLHPNKIITHPLEVEASTRFIDRKPLNITVCFLITQQNVVVEILV